MIRQKFLLCALILLFQTVAGLAQINRTHIGNGVLKHRISPGVYPPLQAPEFYSYFWWFGDNYFSYHDEPEHLYRETSTANNAMVIPTINYSHSGPPPLASISAPSTSNHHSNDSHIVLTGDKIRFQYYRNAVPDSRMYLVASYAPRTVSSGEGEISIIPESGKEHYFDIPSSIPASYTPSGETQTSGSLNWFTLLDSNDPDKSILIPLDVTSQISEIMYSMIEFKCEFRVAGQLVDTKSLSVQVLPSHDPNCMTTNKPVVSNCNISGEQFTYRVDFQNTGEGPTSKVIVQSMLDSRLEMSTINITRFHKRIPLCPVSAHKPCYELTMRPNNVAVFKFDGLVLRGTNEPKPGDERLTRGFVEFTINAKPNTVLGNDLVCFSKITFDTNDPITTNNAKTTCPQDEEPTPVIVGGIKNKVSWLIGLIVLVALVLGVFRKRIGRV